MNIIKNEEKAGVSPETGKLETVELGIKCLFREELLFDREFGAGGRFRLPACSTAFESWAMQKLLTKELNSVKQNILEFLPEFLGHKDIFFLDFFLESETDSIDLVVSLDPVQCIIPDNFDFAKIDRMLLGELNSFTKKIGLESAFKKTKTQNEVSDE